MKKKVKVIIFPAIAALILLAWPDAAAALILVVISIGVYFLPSVIAASRGHPHALPIFLLNLFLGWTVLGWVAALVWSAMPVTQPGLRGVRQ